MSRIRYHWTSFSRRPSFKVLNSSCQGSNLLEKFVKLMSGWWSNNMLYDDSKGHHAFIDDVCLTKFKAMIKPLNLIKPTWVLLELKKHVSWWRRNDNVIGNLSEVENGWEISQQSVSHANLSMVSFPLAIKQSSVSNSAYILVQSCKHLNLAIKHSAHLLHCILHSLRVFCKPQQKATLPGGLTSPQTLPSWPTI